jgi:hypothetical protein
LHRHRVIKLNPDAYDDILTKWNEGVRQRLIGE